VFETMRSISYRGRLRQWGIFAEAGSMHFGIIVEPSGQAHALTP